MGSGCGLLPRLQLFLVNLEVSIVTTSLVAIANDLGSFDNLSWVMSSYLLGYAGFIVITAKLSDIFGRKALFAISIAIFVIFSGACGGAQTVTQLVIFRAFQGVGGSGCFSLCSVIILELVPHEHYATYVSNMGFTSFLALLTGPVIGGSLSSRASWRWVFVLNVPIGAVALLLAIICIPRGFPYHGSITCEQPSSSNFGRLSKLDIPGTILILLGTLALTAGFTEADTRYPWKSVYVITLLITGGLLWVALLFWERKITQVSKIREPILPWHFIENRRVFGVLLHFLLLGGPSLVTLFQLPQMFQLVYGLSGLDAGVRVIAFTAPMAAGTIISAAITGKAKIPPIYLLLFGSCLQIIGFSLLSQLPFDLVIPPQVYVFQVLAGLGCGINFTLLYLLIPFKVTVRDKAVGMGAATQFRMMGSAIILAITTTVFNGYTKAELNDLGVIDFNLDTDPGPSLAVLSPEMQAAVRLILKEGYSRQLVVLAAFAAAQVPATLLLWEKENVVI